jgi:hypothetical protein
MAIARLLLMLTVVFQTGAGVSFNREVRPLLASKCIECHGPHQAKGKLRLDGMMPVPKDKILERIQTKDPDEVMPPGDSNKGGLSAAEIATLRSWVEEGATFEKHWAFETVRRPAIPSGLASNVVDAFLAPVKKKAPETVLRRRLAFDLLGLPPRAGDESKTFDELVDSYLALPAFGERMAVWWLDLVRYADSEGYFYDAERNVYPYRDYVIRAFNENKPFDRFTMEQLAGDLLEGAGWEERIASGYNRLIMTTQEDGANEADYRARYAADRVKNLGSVWLGLSLGCAQCHDHKTDPISTADFYRTAAFFADVKESAVTKQEEVFVVEPSAEYQELLEKSAEIKRVFGALEAETACAQIVAEDEMRRTQTAWDFWPKSKKTDEMLAVVLKENCTDQEKATLAAYFRRHFTRKLNFELSQLQAARKKFEADAAQTLVTEKGPTGTVRILPRGNWLDQKGAQVSAGFLEFLGGNCEKAERMDRLDLAKWIVARENPLTARVLANRLWALFYGEGLVASLDDFGTQTAAPEKGALLDWLAAELMESGWDLKRVIRVLVTSETYSGAQHGSLLPAEFLRDNALAISGLLSEGRGGRPVKTELPDDYLRTRGSINDAYEADSGERLYRRGVYLHRTRASVHPMLAAFNASSREECAATRIDSQTPQQALALLNAPEFVVAARAFAERIYGAAADDRVRVEAAVKFAVGRGAQEKEITILLKLLKEQRAAFAANPVSAAQFIRTGNYRWPQSISAEELAAWTNVARILLNLEETHTRY